SPARKSPDESALPQKVRILTAESKATAPRVAPLAACVPAVLLSLFVALKLGRCLPAAVRFPSLAFPDRARLSFHVQRARTSVQQPPTRDVRATHSFGAGSCAVGP